MIKPHVTDAQGELITGITEIASNKLHIDGQMVADALRLHKVDYNFAAPMTAIDDPKPTASDQRARDVIDGITSGSIGKADRKLIRDTIDQKDAPLTGPAARDQSLGRAINNKRQW